MQNVLVDGGYTGKPFATAVQGLLGAAVEVVKRNELHTFVVLPKRWVVERSFAWLEKCRRLWKNCERKLNTSLQMVVLAFTVNPSSGGTGPLSSLEDKSRVSRDVKLPSSGGMFPLNPIGSSSPTGPNCELGY